jgi:hypothetical protein
MKRIIHNQEILGSGRKIRRLVDGKNTICEDKGEEWS